MCNTYTFYIYQYCIHLCYYYLLLYFLSVECLFLFTFPVMCNFTCQLDWATRCPDIWSNIILAVSVSVRMFLDEINIWIRRLSKADCPLWCGWPSSNQLKPWVEQKGWSFPKYDGTPSALLAWAGPLVFFFLCSWTKASALVGSCMSLLALGLELKPSALLSLQLANCRSWDCSSLIIRNKNQFPVIKLWLMLYNRLIPDAKSKRQAQLCKHRFITGLFCIH